MCIRDTWRIAGGLGFLLLLAGSLRVGYLAYQVTRVREHAGLDERHFFPVAFLEEADAQVTDKGDVDEEAALAMYRRRMLSALREVADKDAAVNGIKVEYLERGQRAFLHVLFLIGAVAVLVAVGSVICKA